MLAWARTSHGRRAIAALMWWFTCASVYWFVRDVHRIWGSVSRTGAARMWCEARGGYYGAMEGKPELCYGETVSAGTSDKNAPSASR
jgi:hypothetical protein